jgi:hypothetical protein
LRHRFQDREVIDRDSTFQSAAAALPDRLGPPSTPGKWREAMEVFTEVNRIGMDAYGELAKAATSSALHIRQRRRRPAVPGTAQLPAPPP